MSSSSGKRSRIVATKLMLCFCHAAMVYPAADIMLIPKEEAAAVALEGSRASCLCGRQWAWHQAERKRVSRIALDR
jgi:hypothetical protein